MKKLQTIFAGLLLACVSGMFYHALTTPGIMQNYGIAFTFMLITGGLVFFTASTKKYNDNDRDGE